MSSLLGSKYSSTAPLGGEEPQVENSNTTVEPTVPQDVKQNVPQNAPVSFWDDEDEMDALVGETEVSFDDDEDALKGTPGIAENTNEYSMFERIKVNTNKIAYGAVKGLAGLSDLATAPGWALANTMLPEGQATTMPFSKMLEQFYPAKNYTFEDDPDSYADEALRIAQTTVEFVTPAGPMNVGARAVIKGSTSAALSLADDLALKGVQRASSGYVTSVASDNLMSAASGLAYQGILEGDGGQTAAMIASFIAPMSPSVARTGWSVTKATPKTILKTAELTPLVGTVIQLAKREGHSALHSLKAKLKGNPEAWEVNWFTRQAKAQILKVGDSAHSLEEQITNIQELGSLVHKVIDTSNPDIISHRDKMQNIQDMINADLPPESKLKLTIEQIYRPVLKDMNDVEGFDTLVDSVRLTNEEAYSNNIRQNHKAMSLYLKNTSAKLKKEDTEAFMQVFKIHTDELIKEQELITNAALGMDFMGTRTVVGSPTVYMYPNIPMEEGLLKATDEIRGLLNGAWEGMLRKLPQDVELDTTPLKHSIEKMYDQMGSLSDPQSVPPYVKALMKQLMAIGDDGQTQASKQIHDELLFREAEVSKAIRGFKRDKQALVAKHKAQLKEIPEDLEQAEKVALRKKYQDEYDEALFPVKAARQPLDDELEQLGVSKREQRIETESLKNFDEIPEPNFTDLGSVREAIEIVGDKLRTAFKVGDQDRIDNLSIIKEGLENTLDSLKDIDKDAYTLYNTGRQAHREFSARDIRESKAALITDKKGGQRSRLTSDDAVTELWENGTAKDIQYFMANFDPTRTGIKEYVGFADDIEVLAADELVASSAKGVKAMQDIVFTHMAAGIREFDLKTYSDPVAQLKDIEDYVRKYVNKHAAKLEKIPGFEKQPSTLGKIVKELGAYRLQMRDLDEQRNLGILKNILGPNHTIMRASKDVQIAQELADFLETTAGSPDKTVVLAGERIRKTMYNSLLQQYTKGTKLDSEGLLNLLSRDSDARFNLSIVLGEPQMGKLEAQAIMSAAIQEGSTTLTDTLTKDKWLKMMESHGISMGRIGSLLSRRAVFTPSAGYIAGAFMTNLMDTLGRKDTSRALGVLFDNPFSLTEMDNFVLQTIDGLHARQKAIIESGLQKRNLVGSVRVLDRAVAKVIRPYLMSLGFQLSEEELSKLMKDTLLQEIPDGTKETESTPKEPSVSQMEEELGMVPAVNPSTQNDMVSADPMSNPPPGITEEVLKTNVPQDTPPITQGAPAVPSDPTTALSTRKSIGEIRNEK